MTPSKSRPKPKPSKLTPNSTSGEIDARKVYVFDAACKELRWKRHSKAQAIRNGLRTCKFGSRRYVLGADILQFFEKLSQEQNSNP